MGFRRKARECALQMLYTLEMTGDPEIRVRKGYWAANPAPPETRDLADRLLVAASKDRERIDRLISESATNWRLDRMSAIDRNVLRLGVAELLHERETPRNVVLDEAIEIARKYGTDESPRFVNGVLDAVKRALEQEEARTA